MRAFVAIDLDEPVIGAVTRLMDRLRGEAPALQWVGVHALHLTLKFLGEISDQQAVAAGRALESMGQACAPFEISLHGLGAFPPRGAPRVLWIGIDDPDAALAKCQARTEALMESAGFPREGRAFSPHLTIARSRSGRDAEMIRRAVTGHGDFRTGTQTVECVTLYQSTLTPQGPIHRPLSRHALRGGRERQGPLCGA